MNPIEVLKRQHIWLSSGKDFDALPPHVQATIEKQQDSSERLIGWIQLFILTLFALLYAAAPKTLPETAAFEPVPLFLGAYFIFTCLRLYLSYTDRLSFSLLVISVFVDMILLLGLIWSFHIQYMQPISFALKAPTLLYIFIFIALRALRFEPGFVLLSGLVAASGWFLLTVLAIFDNTGSTIVTRDYVQYLTSNSLLVGGELDKIISILVVTAILTYAISRGRSLLIKSIVDSRNAENLSLFVPESVAVRIAQSDGPLIQDRTETREATILFIDLVSFTTLAEDMAPDTLIATLNEYFSVIAEPIERYGGVISQFQGDAILASFNLPTKDTNHANSALSAAHEIIEKLKLHRFVSGVRLSIRFGINSGIVVGGFVGTPDRLSYTVYGDTVNIAARLQERCKHFQVDNLVTARTRELADEQRFRFTSKGTELLRGRSGEIEIYTTSLSREQTL